MCRVPDPVVTFSLTQLDVWFLSADNLKLQLLVLTFNF
jgi:hypothetical protein